MLGKISNLAATVDLVAMIHCDYYVPAGMHRASSAALLCADLAGGNVPLWTIQAERRGGVRRASRFRLFHHEPSAPAFGVRETPEAAADAQVNLLLPHALAPSSWRLGLINLFADSDGVARSYQLGSLR